MHLFFSCSTQLRNYSVTNVRVRLKTSTRVHFVHFFRTNAKCFRNGSAHKHSFFRKKLETRSLKRFLLVPNKSTLKKKNIYIYHQRQKIKINFPFLESFESLVLSSSDDIISDILSHHDLQNISNSRRYTNRRMQSLENVQTLKWRGVK